METGKNKILIVDDTKHVVVLLKHYCSRAGYDTIEASDGKEAILKIYNQKPDLVLLDAMMPEMSGFEVLKLLRNNVKTKFLPVIMVTALSELEDRVAALDAGVDDFLTKPVDSLLLITKIKSLLKAKNQRRELDKIKFDFTSMLINGLKKPMNNINNFLNDAQITNLSNEQKSIASGILDNGKEMLEIINKFVDFSGLGAKKLFLNNKIENICSIVDDVIKNYEIICSDKDIKIEKIYDDNIPEISLDKDRILEVTVNILERAINNIQKDGKIIFRVEKKDNYVYVSVSDNGNNISDEELSNMFYPFSLIPNKTDAVDIEDNLSMAISKIIIESHYGEITAESKTDIGNVFIYKLPVSVN
jgi:two-component system, sensor histidine kinase and response regulator